jgi:predicted dehydrogenase
MNNSMLKKTSTPIRVGLVGAGMIAGNHAETFKQTGEAEVIWVSATREESIRSFQSKYQIANGTLNYHDILADPEVDAVVIASPPFTHPDIFIECLRAGKHVLLEKPAAIDRAGLAAMLKERAGHPELVVCDCSCRHARLQPIFKKVREIIDSGTLGGVYAIHHNAVFRRNRPGIEYHPSAKWFLNKKLAGGGPVFDWGVYDLSFHLGLLDDSPKLLAVDSAFTKNGLDRVDPGTDVFDIEEHFAAAMRFSGGLSYYWERSSNANMDVPNETRIYGTRAGLKCHSCTWDPPVIELFDVEDDGKGKLRKTLIDVDMSKHRSDGFELARHFVNSVLGREEPAMPLELAAKHLEILFSVYDKAMDQSQ